MDKTSIHIKDVILPFFKVAAGASLLYYLIYKINWVVVPQLLANSNKCLLAFAVFCYLFKNFTDAVKWSVANRLYHIKIPFRQLVKYEIIGPAFDFISPIPQSEDLYKFYMLQKSANNTTFAISIPLLMRIIGLFTTTLFLPLMIIHYRSTLSPDINFKLLYVAAIITALFLTAYFSQNWWGQKLPSLFDWVTKIINQIKLSVTLATNNTGILLRLLFINMIAHLSYVGFVWFLCLSVDIDVPFYILMAGLPLIYSIAIIPISTGGIGLKEGGWLWVLTANGFNADAAQGVIILHLLIFLSYIIIGTLLFFREKNL